MRLEILSKPSVDQLEAELDRLRGQFRNIESAKIADIEAFRKENLI